MTEKQKAEAYVRSQIPELNQSRLCMVDVMNPESDEVEQVFSEPQLQHWLRVLGDSYLFKGATLYDDVSGEIGEPLLHFDLTTGQPATEADYKAFNDIMGV